MLYYAPLSFLSHIGSHSTEWLLDLWQTFFSSSLGASIPILVRHPRTLCACKKPHLGHHPTDHVQDMIVTFLFHISQLLAYRRLRLLLGVDKMFPLDAQ